MSAKAVGSEEGRLKEGLTQLGLQLDQAQIQQLLDYQGLIAKWNQVYNLTAVRDPAEMLTHHLLDTLAAVPALQQHLHKRGLELGGKLLDVGSGAGLPGVVFAICCPTLQVSCIDTVGKKAAFITQAALALELSNLRGMHGRVETIKESFDIICARAFASLLNFTGWSKDALAQEGAWLAMKGKYPAEEVAALPKSIEVFHVEQLIVPGLAAERCVLWLRQRLT